MFLEIHTLASKQAKSGYLLQSYEALWLSLASSKEGLSRLNLLTDVANIVTLLYIKHIPPPKRSRICAIPTRPLGKNEKGGRCRINRYVNSRGRQTRERTRAYVRTTRRHVAHFPMAIFTECSVFTYRRPTHPYLHLPGMLCLKLSP